MIKMKSYGICPASCGEFVQGIIDDEEYLCS
ncbi:TPA: cobalamin biosynthesis protein, partial [Clostridioides difficile]|nr:cobalamin biosynthesis protein [Clostridioides difficile]